MGTSNAKNRQGKTIKLRLATLNRINALKHKGQSYDGLITELLDSYDRVAMKDRGTQSSKKMRNKHGGT